MTTYKATDQVHVAGDSITSAGINWQGVAGGFFDQLNVQRYARPVPSYIVPTFPISGSRAGTPLAPYPIQTSFGVPGWTIADLKANQVAAIQVFHPDLLVIEIAVNDFTFGTNVAQFTSDYASVLTTTRALFPKVKVLCMGILCNLEQWTHVGPAYLSGVSTNPYDTAIQSLCAARASWTEYVEQKAWTLALNVAGNTPEPGLNAFLTSDGIHPLTATKILMGTHVMSHLTLID